MAVPTNYMPRCFRSSETLSDSFELTMPVS